MPTYKTSGWLFVLLLAGALTGCAAFIEGIQDAQPTSPALAAARG